MENPEQTSVRSATADRLSVVAFPPLDAGERDISLFELANALLRYRRGLITIVLAAIVLAVLPSFFQAAHYTADTAFFPNSSDDGRSTLSGLAGQLGVVLPVAGARSSESPQFYVDLVQSYSILGRVVDDSIVVPELQGRRMRVGDVFQLRAATPAQFRDVSIKTLQAAIKADATRETGVVNLSVTTPYPSVSAEIANRLLHALSEFNLSTRQSQAAAERRFVEQRQGIALDSLRAAEDRLSEFLRANREYRNSPELNLEYDRLQRDVVFQQQLYTTLSQSYENARIREVRSVPVFTVIDAPHAPLRADPRRRAIRGLIGLLVGLVIGALYALVRHALSSAEAASDADATELVSTVRQMRHRFTNLLARNRTSTNID